MALTLLDMANLETEPLRKGVLMTMLEEPFVVDRIPWENVGSLDVTVTYVSGVPVVGFRNINEAPGTVEVSTAQRQVSLKVLETNIDVDWVLTKTKNVVQNPRTLQTQVVMKGISYTVNDLFLNGDPLANPKNPTGLKYLSEYEVRFQGGVTTGNDRGQVLDAAGLNCNSGNATLQYQLLDKIDACIYKVEGHKPDVALLNMQELLLVRSILRQLKLLDTTKDQFDRKIDVYMGIPLLDIGVKAEGAILGAAANQCLLNDGETSPFAATGSTSSIYLVRWGDLYVQGLQMQPLQTEDLGRLKDSPHIVRTNVSWVMGFNVNSMRSFSRLCGLDVSA